jgi:hypothetical protein
MFWKVRGNAAMHDLVAWHGADLLAFEAHGAGGGVEDPRDDVEHRSLAGTVGADDGEHLAVLHAETDVVDGLHAAKAQRHLVDFEHAHL